MPSEKKIKVVEEMRQLIDKYPVIGMIDLYKMPSKQLQSIKKELRGHAIIKMYKKRLMKLAIKKIKKKDVDKLLDLDPKEPCLIFSDFDPFKLSKILEKNKSPTFAKAGDITKHSIIIPAGPTPLMAGPAIGELQRLKIQAMVKDGKIHVRKDKTIAKAGDEINEQTAGLLKKLDIQTMEVGINLLGAWENGTIFKKDVLTIDEQEYLNKISLGSRSALNLSIEIGYITKDSVLVLLQKGFRQAKALGTEAKIFEKGVVEDLISKANAHANVLKSKTIN